VTGRAGIAGASLGDIGDIINFVTIERQEKANGRANMCCSESRSQKKRNGGGKEE
jgi:hypothetical protein